MYVKCTIINDENITVPSLDSSHNFLRASMCIMKLEWFRVRSPLTSFLVSYISWIDTCPCHRSARVFSLFLSLSLVPRDYRSMGIRVLRQPVLRATFFATKKFCYVVTHVRLGMLCNCTLSPER